MRGGRDERGVSLVLVLVALVVFGLLVPVLGQFGSTNGVSGYLLEGQRYDRYAAETGMQEAIAWAQANRAAGRQGVPCPEIQTGTIGSGNGARSVTVKCKGYTLTGYHQATGSAPEFAIQGTGGTISLEGGNYRTAGPWWSNGSIDVSGTIDASRDYVGAGGSCDGIQAAPTDCNTGRTENPPGWAVLPGSRPAPEFVDRPRPIGCRSSDRVIAIEPGFHWQRPYFDAIADGDDGCDHVVLWLKPGYHVFDFDFYGLQGSSPSFRAVTGHVVIVGGTPNGWGPGSSFDAVDAAVRARTACDPAAAGAEIATASSTYFELNPDSGNTADMQICGIPQGGVPVAFAQARGGTTPTERTVVATPTAVAADGHGASFIWPSGMPRPPAPDPLKTRECSSFGGGACDAAHVMTGRLTGDRATGTVVMTMNDPIPDGSRMDRPDALQLTVNHREQVRDGGIRRLRLFVTGLGSVADVCDFTRSDHRLDPRNPWPRSTESADVFTCDLRGNREPYFGSGGPVRVYYEVQLDSGSRDGPRPSVDVTLDQVELKAIYDEAAFRDATPLAGGQAVFKADRQARATFDGAVDAPTGYVWLDFARSTENGFRGGVVARQFLGQNLPNDPTYAPFELPGGGSYTDRVVTFAAYVAGSEDPSAMLTARVVFCDPVPGLLPRNAKCTATPPDTQPQVVGWHARR